MIFSSPVSDNKTLFKKIGCTKDFSKMLEFLKSSCTQVLKFDKIQLSSSVTCLKKKDTIQLFLQCNVRVIIFLTYSASTV